MRFELPAEEHLLAAVRAEPDDDAPRLVLADTLQETEHPWGEFIAVQCRLARELEPTPARASLLRREQALLQARETWWPYDGSGFAAGSFERGFPTRIHAASVAGLRTLSKRIPWLPDVASIEVPLLESDMLGLVGLPRLPTRGFSFVSGSNYYFDSLDARMFVRWLEAKEMTLRSFGYSGAAPRDLLRDVIALHAASIEDLGLAYVNAGLWNQVDDLLTLPGRLRRLAIAGHVAPQLSTSVAATIEDFELSHSRPIPDWWEPLVTGLSHARRLDLRAVSLARGALPELLDLVSPELQHLGIAENQLDADDLDALATHRLESLDVHGNPIGDAGAKLLATTSVTSLDVASTGLTEHGARALLASSTLPPTLRLAVSEAEVGAQLSALRERYAVVIAR